MARVSEMDQDSLKRQHNWAVGRIRYEREKQDWLAIGIVHSQNDSSRQPVPLQIALVNSGGEVVLNTLVRPPVTWKHDRVSPELLTLLETTSEVLFLAPAWEEIVPLMTKASIHRTFICWDLVKTKQLLTILARGKNKGVSLPANRRFLNMHHEYPNLIQESDQPPNSNEEPSGNALAIALRLAEMMHSFDDTVEFDVPDSPTVYYAEVRVDLPQIYEPAQACKQPQSYDFEAEEEETREYLKQTKISGLSFDPVKIAFIAIAFLFILTISLAGCIGQK